LLKISRFASVHLLLGSFLLVILLGSLLLGLPIANNREVLPYLDNLFIATSATCVTGLMPTVTMEQFSFVGQLILLILIQIGGLGLMTFIAFFVIIGKRNRKLKFSNKQVMMDTLNSFSVKDTQSFLINIFRYTFIFELSGAVLFSLRFIPKYGLSDGIFKSIFLSVSAFCNAGIDNLSDSSLVFLQTDPLINFVVIFLIIMGGLGFTVWFDIGKKLVKGVKNKWQARQIFNSLFLHTKLVLLFNGFLLISGAVFIFIIEYNNPLILQGLNPFNKIMTSLFTSTTLRTAGFATVNFANFTNGSKVLMFLYMIIGGSPGGTAGGIKTTTFFIVWLMLLTELRGKKRIQIFNREIARTNFYRAFVIVGFYFVAVFIASIFLVNTEDLPPLSVLFEIFSAIGTVGLSTGITASLSVAGKVIITILMFMGRVGPLSIITSILINRKETSVRYPSAEVLIG